MMRLGRILRDYSEAGAINSPIALWGFVDDHTFLTKSGHVGIVHERRSEETLDRAVERGGVVEGDHMRRVRENGELGVRDVLIDLDGVPVDDRIVIARQDHGRRRDGFERLGLDVCLLKASCRSP